MANNNWTKSIRVGRDNSKELKPAITWGIIGACVVLVIVLACVLFYKK